MAARNGRTPEEVRQEIESERNELASAVDELREGIGQVTDVGGKLRTNLPAAAAGALVVGFVLAGGIGATMRLAFRRGREGETKARLGPFSLVDRS
jgi:Protein of unknown function (DUF3618)